jgi:hypothetical protein
VRAPEILQRARETGIRHITSDDAGIYTCHQCGNQWQRRERYVWWPVRVGWHLQGRPWRQFFAWHGWQVGSDGIEQRVFGQTFHIGRLFIAFGRDHTRAAGGGAL